MVRPRADNYDERRQEIRDAAAAIFAERGFDGTSIADIARKCGVSKALLYHYYDSKEALLYDMLHSHCRLLAETATESLHEQALPEQQLGNLVRALMRLYMGSRDKHVVLLNDLHCLPADQQRQIRELERQVLQVIRNLLAKLRPDLDAPIIASLSMYLMGAINWTYTWFNPHGAMSAGEYADLATAIFLNGVLGELPAA
jgi:AcrR family transcriptional regulator